jgi:hypothetical protein
MDDSFLCTGGAGDKVKILEFSKNWVKLEYLFEILKNMFVVCRK